MGGLKDQDPALGSTTNTEPPIKKKPGNPNFAKGKKNYIYNKSKDQPQEQKTMATEEAEVVNNSQDVSGDKKAIPVDEFSDVIPTTVLPLDGETPKKDYTNIKDPNTNPNTTVNPGTVPPPVNPLVTDPNVIPPGGVPPVQSEEARTKAEQAVKMALNLYEKLHGVGRHLGKMSEADQNSLHLAGKINLNHNLPLGKGATTLGGFIQQINDEIDENIVVEQKFKDDITPPLTRIAIKNNWGLSDEWYCLALVGEDVVTKAAVLFSMKHTLNLVLESCLRAEKLAKEANDPKKKPEKKPEENTSADKNSDDPNVKDVSWEDMKDVPSQ